MFDGLLTFFMTILPRTETTQLIAFQINRLWGGGV